MISIDSLKKDATPLGDGSEACVYKIKASTLGIQSDCALKRYHSEVLSGNEAALGVHLTNLIDFRKNQLTPREKDFIDYMTVWPRQVVYHNGDACGYLMPLIPECFFEKCNRFGEVKKIESTFDLALTSEHLRRVMGLTCINPQGRIRIVFDLLRLVSLLHGKGVVIGDISSSNILVHIDPNDQLKYNRAMIIDLASARMELHVHPLSQHHSANWIPPECYAAGKLAKELRQENGDTQKIKMLDTISTIQGKDTDIWKLCVAIERLYHTGHHTAIVEFSESSQERISHEIGTPFADAVRRGLSGSPKQRPSADELFTNFRSCLQTK